MRDIVRIDEDKCDGCGVCVPSCAEGAIQVVDGKARLVAENLCDGLGACLGTCPKGAITIEQRPAEAFDEQAVEAANAGGAEGQAPERPDAGDAPAELPCGCPRTIMRKLDGRDDDAPDTAPGGTDAADGLARSRLGQWPVQLSLLPPTGDIWDGADVLLAADCAAYAVGDFHDRFLAGRTLAIACPKLDEVAAYNTKSRRIVADNAVRSITVVRMEVPCCSGLETLAREAIAASGRDVPLNVVTVGVDGDVQNVNGLKVA
ncbi:MAG: 4Fe-4S binding protein [Phycisphaerae bacterium]|nr:4Fe-4S binding protein [Phycisphaerae bacterium]